MRNRVQGLTNLAFTDLSLRKKAMTGFVVFCLLLNALSPRIIFEIKGRGLITTAMSGQPVVKQVMSLSALSLKIARFLLRAPSGKAGIPPDTQKAKANSSSDFSLVTLTKKDNPSRNGILATPGLAGTFCFREMQSVGSGLPRAPAPVPLYVILLMLLYSFARSTTDDAARSFRRSSVYPIPFRGIGFFVFSDDTSAMFVISISRFGGLS